MTSGEDQTINLAGRFDWLQQASAGSKAYLANVRIIAWPAQDRTPRFMSNLVFDTAQKPFRTDAHSQSLSANDSITALACGLLLSGGFQTPKGTRKVFTIGSFLVT